MAEPLTSSDIWRIERGWGTSGLASPEERQRFAAAGELPISGMEAAKLAEGRGISPMASKAEKKAWVASEVMLGLRGSEDMPEEYGGRPQVTLRPRFDERGQPTGAYRRQMRMQEAWDAQQKQLQDIQRQQFEQDATMKQIELRQLEYNRALENDILDKESKLQDEIDAAEARKHAFEVSNAIRGVTLPNGQRLRPIRPEDPDAIERLNDIARLNPRFIENDLGKKIWESTLTRAEAYAQKAAQDMQQDSEKLQEWAIGQNQEAATLGIDASKFYEIDQSGNIIRADRIGLSKAIGEAKRRDIESKAKAALSADISKENRQTINGIVDQIYKTGSQIRENDSLIESARSSIERNELIRKANYLRGEDAVLRQRLSEFVPQVAEKNQEQPKQPQTTGQRPALGDIFGGR